MADSTTVTAVSAPGTFAYSDADWGKIKTCLARLDIDADAVMVGDRWWAQPPIAAPGAAPAAAAPQRPLREQLQELAADYRGLLRFRKERRALTPKQEAAEIQKVLDALARARAALVSSKVGFIAHELALADERARQQGTQTSTYTGAPALKSDDVRKAVDAFTAKAERHIVMLKAAGNRSRANARKAHIEYWGELVVLWRATTVGQHPRILSHFLYVCSAPAFPEETTQGRIKAFLDRLQ
jgi:hypothetical protein